MQNPMSLERDRSAGYLVNWAARLFARAIDRRLKPLGVSSGQLPVFFALAGGRALTQRALTDFAAIEQPTMAATLTRMERDGLIVRRPDPQDRRAALVSLTPEAEERAARVRAATDAVNAAALAGLNAAEQEQVRALLARVIAGLEAAERTEDAEPEKSG